MNFFYQSRFLAMIAAVLSLASLQAMAAPPARVLIAPFESTGPADKGWIAKAVQQNLVAELSRVNSVEPVTHDKPIPDKESAMKAAKAAGADFVVLGAYQINDADLRITGQVIDVSKNQAIAGLKATGMQRDLFGLEDVIAAQVKRSLPAPVAAAPEMLAQPAAAAPVAAAPVAPVGPDRAADLNRVAGRINDLDERIERAIERLRYLDTVNYSYNNYAFQPIRYYPFGYYPYYTGGYGYGYGGQTNVAIIGGWQGRHSQGQFHVGGTGSWAGARPDGRNYSVPTGNYAVHQGNYIRPLGR